MWQVDFDLHTNIIEQYVNSHKFILHWKDPCELVAQGTLDDVLEISNIRNHVSAQISDDEMYEY